MLRRTALKLLLSLTMPAAIAAETRTPLTLGATSGPFSDMIRQSIKPWLEARGYAVKVVEFSDYVQPNLALAQGALDANVFQHVVYLKKFAADHGLQIEPIVQVPTEPMGLYSHKHRSLDTLSEGARVALPNDPTNAARALGMLARLGWLTLKPDIDPIRASEKDVASNPRKIKLIALEAALLPRALDDADYAFVNGNYAYASGLKLKDALSIEDLGDRYINVVAVRSADRTKPFAADLIAAYRSPEFKAYIEKRFPEFSKPADWPAGARS